MLREPLKPFGYFISVHPFCKTKLILYKAAVYFYGGGMAISAISRFYLCYFSIPDKQLQANAGISKAVENMRRVNFSPVP
jgi:hypothetical protein